MASLTQENLSKLQEIVEDKEPGMLQSMGLKRVRQDLATEQQEGSKRFGRESLKSDSITNLSSHCSLWKL